MEDLLSGGAGCGAAAGMDFAGAAADAAIAAGLMASMAAWSFFLPRQATPTAAAIIAAPTATSTRTVRDMQLPLVRRPTAIGVALRPGEMISWRSAAERH
jgi:hypothetical protein